MPHIRSLLLPVLEHPACRGVVASLLTGQSPAMLSGLTPTAKALVPAGLTHLLSAPIIVLTNDNESADRLQTSATTFLNWLEGAGAGTSVNTLPAFDCSPYEGRSAQAEISQRRAVALWNIAQGRTRILFVPLAAALGRFRIGSFYRSLAVEVRLGDEVNLTDLVEHLQGVGYEAGEPVDNVGQFSLRGGIIDIFSP